MIEAENVSVLFKRGLFKPKLKALDGFSLKIREGDFFAYYENLFVEGLLYYIADCVGPGGLYGAYYDYAVAFAFFGAFRYGYHLPGRFEQFGQFRC